MQMLDHQFAKMATGQTVQKCENFFIAAAIDAGFELSPFIKQPGKRLASNNRTKKNKTPYQRKSSKSNQIDEIQETPPPPNMSWHELLLSKFPSFDPSWPDEVKANWFTSFNELMRKGDNANK